MAWGGHFINDYRIERKCACGRYVWFVAYLPPECSHCFHKRLNAQKPPPK